MELYNYYPCHSLITNLGRIKYTFIDGKEYIVAPMTTIVPGVLNGSKGALYYPPDEIKRNVREWDNIPITVYHPDVAGRHASASEPGVMERQGIGFLAKSEYKGKLVHEGYFDIERTKIVDNRVLEALETGQAIELSTGLFTENEPAIPGANYNGKGYDYIARNYKPDHLAVLPDQIGACSILDGCGVLVNSFFVDHLESSNMEIETTDNTDDSYTSSIHGNGTVDIDLATDLREGSSKGSINNSTVPYINGDTSTHSILHRMFEWLVSNSGISRVDIAVNANPEGINQYSKGGATSEAAKASSKLSGSAKGKEALGLAQRAMASSGSGNSEKAAARHTEAAAAHREAAKAGGKDSTSHLQAAELHEKAAELHKADKPGSRTTPSPNPRTAVPATKPVSAPSPSPKSTSTPATVTPKGTLTSAHVVQAIKDVHKGGLADMADVREHELLKGHSKEHQDEAIAKARSEGKVSGSSYEGRHGVSERQKAAVHVDKWGEKIGGLAVRNEEMNTENSSLEHNAMGRGNWSLSKRSEHANNLTEKANQASSNIDDDSTEEDHQTAFQVHKEAADAHRMAAREAATGSSRGGEKDFAASGYHANKAAYHADKADQHGKECGMVENSNPEGINQYTNGGVGTVADHIEHAVSSAKGRKELATSMKGIAKETNASIRDAAKGAVRGVHAEDLGSHPGHVRSAIKSILAQHSTDFANDLIGHVNHETSYTHKQLKGGESKSQIQAVIGSAREELGSKGVKDKFDFNAGYMHKDLVSALKSHGHTHESAHQEASRIIGRLSHRLGIESHTSNVDNTDTYDTSSPPSFTPSIPTPKLGKREKKLKPGKASAYGSGEAKTKIEDSEDRFKPVVPAPPASQKLTPPSSTEPLPSSNANPISRDSEGQFTSKDKDKRATSSDSKGSNSGSKSSGFSDPEDDNPEEGDEEKVARLGRVGAYNANPEGINQYSKMGKLTAESKIRVGASKIGTSKKALAGTNKVSEGSITHEAAAGLHDKAAEYHTAMGNSDIADAHKYLAGYHRSKASSTENQAMAMTHEDILTNEELGDSSRFTSNDERLGAFKEMVQVYNDGFASDEQRQAFWGLFAEHAKEMSKAAGGKVERGGPESHTGREGTQSHTGREGPQSHTGREGTQSHTGREGTESHTGREGTQSHTGREGPTKAEPKAEKQESKASTKVAPPKPEKSAEEKSGIAAGASKLARKQGKRDTYKYGRAHARAASAHAEAASAHAASGNHALAEKHSKAASEHAATAKKHGIVGNSYLSNQDNPFVGEFDMTREADITWLATNCDCWKGPGDLETLNMLSDEKLATLKDVARHSLAEKYALRRGLKVGKKHYTWNAATGRFDTKKVVKAGVEQAGGEEQEDEYNVNADDEDYDSDEEDDMDEDDEDVAKRFRGMKDTRNKATMNMQQWESSMPPEARRVWNLAKSVEANTRNTLIQQLIANVYGDKERQLLYNTLKDKSMQELQVLANLVPPSVGYGTPDFIPQSYVGASVPAHNRATTNDSESDVLPLPTINFSEWAKGNSGS